MQNYAFCVGFFAQRSLSCNKSSQGLQRLTRSHTGGDIAPKPPSNHPIARGYFVSYRHRSDWAKGLKKGTHLDSTSLPLLLNMEDVRIFRSPIFSRARRSNRVHTSRHLSNSKEGLSASSVDAQAASEEEYDFDELENQGAFNNSSTHVVKASQLVEPAGWYLGCEYYVVTRGSTVGVFHDLSVFICFSPPLPLS